MAKEFQIEFFSGNDVLIQYTVEDEDNPPAAKDLTGATEIIFAIARSQGKTSELSLSLTGNPTQVVITDAVNGVFTVSLTKANTEPLGDKHQYHECRVTDQAGKTATVGYGTATIQPNTITT